MLKFVEVAAIIPLRRGEGKRLVPSSLSRASNETHETPLTRRVAFQATSVRQDPLKDPGMLLRVSARRRGTEWTSRLSDQTRSQLSPPPVEECGANAPLLGLNSFWRPGSTSATPCSPGKRGAEESALRDELTCYSLDNSPTVEGSRWLTHVVREPAHAYAKEMRQRRGSATRLGESKDELELKDGLAVVVLINLPATKKR